jgi:hypothetical protein
MKSRRFARPWPGCPSTRSNHRRTANVWPPTNAFERAWQADAWLSSTRLEESEHQLHRRRVELEEVSVEASRTREQLGCTRDRLRETQEQMVRSHVEARDLLIRSRAEVHELHTRLEYFERHFVLGPALRGRRRLKSVFGMLRNRAAL